MPEGNTVYLEQATGTRVDLRRRASLVQYHTVRGSEPIGVYLTLEDGRELFLTDTVVRHAVEAYKAAGIDL